VKWMSKNLACSFFMLFEVSFGYLIFEAFFSWVLFISCTSNSWPYVCFELVFEPLIFYMFLNNTT